MISLMLKCIIFKDFFGYLYYNFHNFIAQYYLFYYQFPVHVSDARWALMCSFLSLNLLYCHDIFNSILSSLSSLH